MTHINRIGAIGGAGAAHARQTLRDLLDFGEMRLAAGGVPVVDAEQNLSARRARKFQAVHGKTHRAVRPVASLDAFDLRDLIYPFDHPRGSFGQRAPARIEVRFKVGVIARVDRVFLSRIVDEDQVSRGLPAQMPYAMTRRNLRAGRARKPPALRCRFGFRDGADNRARSARNSTRLRVTANPPPRRWPPSPPVLFATALAGSWATRCDGGRARWTIRRSANPGTGGAGTVGIVRGISAAIRVGSLRRWPGRPDPPARASRRGLRSARFRASTYPRFCRNTPRTRRTRLRLSLQHSTVTVGPRTLSAKVWRVIGKGSSPGSISTGWRLLRRKFSMAASTVTVL